jgi:hypothetical protein
MTETETSRLDTGQDAAPSGHKNSSPSMYSRHSAAHFQDRLGELEMENARLHRLVAELLIKNQQLRGPD